MRAEASARVSLERSSELCPGAASAPATVRANPRRVMSCIGIEYANRLYATKAATGRGSVGRRALDEAGDVAAKLVQIGFVQIHHVAGIVVFQPDVRAKL